MVTQLACLTLVLHAHGDARVPFEKGQRIAYLIPGARFVPLNSLNPVPLEQEPAFTRCFGETHTFLDAHDAGDHHTPKPYVRQAFRKYLECGIFAHGFARTRSGDCGHNYFVAFSCRGRGVCPSCNTRRVWHGRG